jgi:ubiquinone/menaquinone biosynthesis C-methylase UbiE
MHEKFKKKLKKPIWRVWYWIVSLRDKGSEVRFMNYGYHGENPPLLQEADEMERYPLQLYDLLASAASLENKQMLEVGCGRGGGSSYISRYFKPKHYDAIDLSGKAIKYCKKEYQIANLTHTKADAQNLPFEDNAFDFVINVESSHCYPDIAQFFSEVYRVLSPGGVFLYTDLRNQGNIAFLREKLSDTPFEVLKYENITSNVKNALAIDSKRREDLVDRIAPKFLSATAKDFAGVKDSKTYHLFESGWYEYFFYVLKKK